MLPFVIGLLASATAFAQSDAISRQSDASLRASAQVPVAMVDASSAGGRFSVTSFEASGEAVVLTLSVAGLATSAVIVVSAELVRRLGIVAGTAIGVVAVSGGWLLSVAGEAVAFVADAAATALRTIEALDAHDAPVALVARIGRTCPHTGSSTAMRASRSATMRAAAGRSCICSTPAAAMRRDCTCRDW